MRKSHRVREESGLVIDGGGGELFNTQPRLSLSTGGGAEQQTKPLYVGTPGVKLGCLGRQLGYDLPHLKFQ